MARANPFARPNFLRGRDDDRVVEARDPISYLRAWRQLTRALVRAGADDPVGGASDGDAPECVQEHLDALDSYEFERWCDDEHLTQLARGLNPVENAIMWALASDRLRFADAAAGLSVFQCLEAALGGGPLAEGRILEHAWRLSADGALVRLGLVDVSAEPEVRFLDQMVTATPRLVELIAPPGLGPEALIGGGAPTDRWPGPQREAVEFAPRPPKVRLDQLVLAPSVRRTVDMFVAAAEMADRVQDLVELPWGGATVLGITGPPGTGKSSLAEAIAHAAGYDDVLVAPWAALTSKYVGETERSLTRMFETACAREAAIVLDECDSMLLDRFAPGRRSFEVRWTNTLNRLIEHHGDGIVICVSNAPFDEDDGLLDPALARRLIHKVHVGMPEVDAREQIIRKLSERMPVANDIPWRALAESAPLSGGRLKNVVLTALRLALLRDPKPTVTAADFEEALDADLYGGQPEICERVGFRARSTT